MTLGLCVGMVILGLVCGYFTLTRIAGRVSWYVPSLATAELCKEIKTSLITFRALTESATRDVQSTRESLERITAIEARFTEMSDFLEEQLSAQARRRFSEQMPQISENLLRRVSSQIVTEFKGTVDRGAMSLGSEYVLLQPIDSFEMDVKLEGQYTDIDTLQQAIVAALRFEVKRTDNMVNLANWLEAKQWNNREFHLFAGRIGSELFKLKWYGTLALRKKGERHAQMA